MHHSLHAPRRFSLVLLFLAAGSLAGGCASTYYSNFAFTPAPAEVVLDVRSEGSAQTVRTFVAVRGVRRPVAERDLPAAIEVRFLIDNDSDSEASINPMSLHLVPADLRSLGTPDIEEGVPTAPAHGETTFAALFPLPRGAAPSELDLSGMSISWSITAGETERSQSVSFSRRIIRGRTYGPRRSFYFGYYHPYHFHRHHYDYHDHHHHW